MDTIAPWTSTVNVTYSTLAVDFEALIRSNFSHLEEEIASSSSFHRQPLKRDALYIVIPVTIIYIAIFFTGTIGNISTCIVIARNKSMHTATNYYLFSLAISDLLLLVSGLPAEMYLIWWKYSYIFGEEFCVLRGLAAETSTNASVLTITAFTVERYVAICHPFLAQKMSKLSRAVKLILIVWLVAFSFALPQALQMGLVKYDNPEIEMCTVKRVLLKHSFALSTFLFFVVPMSLITVLYMLIGLKLRKSNMMKRRPGRVEGGGGSCRHHAGRSSRRVLKMLVAVVVAFFICWVPFHVQRLIAIYGTNSEDHITSKSRWLEFLNSLMTYISGVFYYVSTSINPILYNIMSHKFRAAFMETLSRTCRISGLAIRQERSYSSLSRSQQRTGGVYGSIALVAVGGTSHNATECFTGSAREKNPRQMSIRMDNAPRNSVDSTSIRNHVRPERRTEGETKEFAENPQEIERHEEEKEEARNTSVKNGTKDQRCSINEKNHRRGNHSMWFRTTRFTAVKVNSDVDNSTKKWWHLFKWLPNLRILRLGGTNGTEDCAANNQDDKREELSMTPWNPQESTEQRPV